MIQNVGLLSSSNGVDIGSLPEVTPVTGDMLLIEDASDGDTQKKVNASNFLTGSGSIADNAVTNAKLADMASGTFKARLTVGTGDPEDLTATQVRSLLNVADGSTANPNAIDNVVEDTSPQLGGNLDVNGNSIVSTTDADITLAPNGTGKVILGNFSFKVDQTVGASQDNFILKYDDATGVIQLEADTGGSGIGNVVEDTTPQLGGSLDVNGNKIVSVSNGNIDIEPNGTGNVLIGNFTFDADQTVGSGQDNYVLTYDHFTGLISLEASAGGGGAKTSASFNSTSHFSANSIALTTDIVNITWDGLATFDSSYLDYSDISAGEERELRFHNDHTADNDATYSTGDIVPDVSGFTCEPQETIVFIIEKDANGDILWKHGSALKEVS